MKDAEMVKKVVARGARRSGFQAVGPEPDQGESPLPREVCRS